IWRAREQHRRTARVFRDEDHGVELHTVAHRDHDLAAVVVERRAHRAELGRRFAREWILCRGYASTQKEKSRKSQSHWVGDEMSCCSRGGSTAQEQRRDEEQRYAPRS